MTNIIIQKIEEYTEIVVDKIMNSLEKFDKRLEIMEKDLNEIKILMENGDRQKFEEKRKMFMQKTRGELLFINGLKNEVTSLQEKNTKIEKYEEQKNKLEKILRGNKLNPKELMEYLALNPDTDKAISEKIVGKHILFKKHELPIRGYEQGKILVEGIGSVETKSLTKTLENYVISIEGIEINEAMDKINTTTNEQELKQYFKNKIIKHKNYKAKIYDYQDRKFHLIIRADDKFVHGWVHANKPALNQAIDTLSKYSKEHIHQKLEKHKPFGIRSLAQLEMMPPTEREQKIKQLSKWKGPKNEGINEEDEETIKNAVNLQLKEAA